MNWELIAPYQPLIELVFIGGCVLFIIVMWGYAPIAIEWISKKVVKE